MDVRRLLNEVERLELRVEDEDAGERLDLFLARAAFWASRSEVQRWIREGTARVDAVIERRPSARLRAGQRVACDAPKTPRDLGSRIEDLVALPLAHQGDGWVIVVKPPGVPSHPGGGVIKRTLLTAMALRFEGACEAGGPWLPHRLDRETSGLVVVTLRKAVQRRFVDAFEQHGIRRLYDARVRGRMGEDGERLILDAPLKLVATKPMRVAVDPGGLPSRTFARVIRGAEDSSDVEVEPETGRQHQIRVHLAHDGHPIVGDPLYDSRTGEAERMHLHARALEIPAAVAGSEEDIRVSSTAYSFAS